MPRVASHRLLDHSRRGCRAVADLEKAGKSAYFFLLDVEAKRLEEPLAESSLLGLRLFELGLAGRALVLGPRCGALEECCLASNKNG